jgi:hypothetical protein
VIVLSASPHLPVLSGELGARAVFAKPVDLDMLLALVNQASQS